MSSGVLVILNEQPTIMISKRKNPKASPDNALQFLNIHGICCDDNRRALYCKYKLTVDVTSVTTASLISLGGKEYNFGVVVDLTTSEGQKILREKIEQALADSGHTQDGLGISISGNDLTIDTPFSEIAFDYLQASGNAFDKYECKIVGDVKFDDKLCAATATIQKANASTFNLTIPAAVGDNGDVVQLRDSGDVVLVSWVSDGQGTATFQEGGAGYIALSDANYSFSVSGSTLTIQGSDDTLKDLYNLTDTAAIATFAAVDPNYVVIHPVSGDKIVDVTVNDGSNDVYDRAVSTTSTTIVESANAFSQNGKIYLNADGLSYNGNVTFTVTINNETCDDVTESKLLNF